MKKSPNKNQVKYKKIKINNKQKGSFQRYQWTVTTGSVTQNLWAFMGLKIRKNNKYLYRVPRFIFNVRGMCNLANIKLQNNI